jgi:glycogen debranching enzyme
MEIKNIGINDYFAGSKTSAPTLEKPTQAIPLPQEEALLSRETQKVALTQEVKAKPILEQGKALARKVIKKDTFEVTFPGKPGTRHIITAGSDHFKSLWTRDACFASFGLLYDKEGQKIVKDILQSFFDRADAGGQIPRRQGDYGNPFLMLLSFLGFETPAPKKLDRYEYVNDLNAYQFDSTALPLILAHEYYKLTGDKAFLEQNYEVMNKSIAWLEKMDTQQKQRLIDQPGSGDWKDITRRSGIVTYTNVLLHQAFKSMADLNREMGDFHRAEHNQKYAQTIKDDINTQLWDEKLGYYKDSDEVDKFSPDGNILAIIFEVADKRKAGKIFNKLEDFMNHSPLPYPALEGDYPDEYVPLWAKIAGVRHYHDRHIWPWQGNVLAVAAAKTGRIELAEQALKKVAAQAVKDGTFYEIYQPEGKLEPVKTSFYKSEPDFLWSAGTYLWGYRELKEAKKAQSKVEAPAPNQIEAAKVEEYEGYLIS